MIQSELRSVIGTLHQDVQADNPAISHIFLTFMYKLLGHFKEFLVRLIFNFLFFAGFNYAIFGFFA